MLCFSSHQKSKGPIETMLTQAEAKNEPTATPAGAYTSRETENHSLLPCNSAAVGPPEGSSRAALQAMHAITVSIGALAPIAGANEHKRETEMMPTVIFPITFVRATTRTTKQTENAKPPPRSLKSAENMPLNKGCSPASSLVRADDKGIAHATRMRLSQGTPSRIALATSTREEPFDLRTIAASASTAAAQPEVPISPRKPTTPPASGKAPGTNKTAKNSTATTTIWRCSFVSEGHSRPSANTASSLPTSGRKTTRQASTYPTIAIKPIDTLRIVKGTYPMLGRSND